jgi:single-strand DNA-binding protein
MSSLNKVLLIGRLGGDPEQRFTSSGKAVCNFSVATDEIYKDGNGNKQKSTVWHKVVIWDKLAELAQQFLHKGDQVYVEGRISVRKWQDKDQQERTSNEVVAYAFKQLTPKAESAMVAGGGVSDEDIPF